MLFFEDKRGKITAVTTVENGKINEEFFTFNEMYNLYRLNFEYITKDMPKGSKLVGSIFYSSSDDGSSLYQRYNYVTFTEYHNIPVKACQHFIKEKR